MSSAVSRSRSGFWLSLCTAAWVFIAAEFASAGSPTSVALSETARKADDYYLGRRNLQNVHQAIQLLRNSVAANPGDYEAWWRLSKFYCYLARQNQKTVKLKLLDQGIDAGTRAVSVSPARVEGHFWLGANLGLTAEERGMVRGVFLIDRIRSEMETVARLDPDYEQAAGWRTLARLYYRAPFFKGGNKRRSIELLEKCLALYPDNSLAMLYLADSYLAMGLRQEAQEQLERILALCPDPNYGPELAQNQDEARARLAKNFRAENEDRPAPRSLALSAVSRR